MDKQRRKIKSFDLKLVEYTDAQIRDIKNLLLKESRSKEDGEILLSKLTVLEYFNAFVEHFMRGSQHDQIVNICRCLKLEVLPAGVVLFQEGDLDNNKLYIILNGSIALLKRNIYELDVQNHDETPEQRQQLINIFKMSEMSKTATLKEFIELYGGVLRVLQKGDGFGEKALLENKPRTLTAITGEETYLIQLEKKDFDMVRDSFEAQIKSRKELLFNLFNDVINEYSSTRLEQMTYSFKTQELDKGQILTKSGEKSDVFYLLEEGDVQIFSKSDDPNPIPLSTISRGQFIGEEIVLNKSSTYEFTAVVNSTVASFLIISRSLFFSQFPYECKRSVKSTYEDKRRIRLQNQEKFYSNPEFMNIRVNFSIKQLATELRQQQLQTWQSGGISQDFRMEDFILKTSRPECKQVLNRQAINLRGKSNTNNHHHRFKRLDLEETNKPIRKLANSNVFDVNQIVDASEIQLKKKLTDVNSRKISYGIIVADSQMPSQQKINLKTSDTLDLQPKNRLDFGRGDLEKQLKNEHFFQILKSRKPLKVDYMDHNFQILKNVLCRKISEQTFKSEREFKLPLQLGSPIITTYMRDSQVTTPAISVERRSSVYESRVFNYPTTIEAIDRGFLTQRTQRTTRGSPWRTDEKRDAGLQKKFYENKQLKKGVRVPMLKKRSSKSVQALLNL